MLALLTTAAPFTGTVLRNPIPAPPITLTDQYDRTFSLAAQRGRVVLVFFGYTHCPDVCPATMAQLARMYRTLPAASRRRVEIAFVTVDAERDSPATLGRYVALFDAHFIGLTGSLGALDSIYREYHVWHQRMPGSVATGYLVAHGGDIYVIDPQGRLRIRHNWQDDAAAIGHDVQALLR